MRFLLTAPFSSELNLSTFNAYVDEINTINELNRIVDSINQESVNFDWSLCWKKPDDTTSLYRTLDESYTPNALKPIIELKINNVAWITAHLVDSHQDIVNRYIDTIDIDSCVLYLYDNTISILSMYISDKERTLEISDIDEFTFTICTILVDFMKPFIEHMIQNLKNHPYFEEQRGNDQIFDRSTYCLFWVNRTLFINNTQYSELENLINKWSKFYNEENIMHDYMDYKIMFCIGNNVVIYKVAPYNKYVESINIATYFYCLYFLINNKVSKIFEDIENTSVFEKNYVLLYKIERLMLFIDNKHQDIIFSLQGESKSITKNFYKVWDLELLKTTLNFKTSKVYELYKFERLQKTERIGKIVQGTLTIIGASAIIDVALNIVLFSHEEFKENFYSLGPTYLISKVNPDIVLLLCTILITCLAVMIFKEVKKDV